MKRNIYWLIIVVMAVLAACGGGDDDAQALMEQGRRLELQGHDGAALACYRRAMSAADSSDHALLAQAHMRVALLYSNTTTEGHNDIDNYRLALAHYRLAADSAGVLKSLRYMGSQYRRTDCDSARQVLNQAMQLAHELEDSHAWLYCVDALARTCYLDSDYTAARDLALRCIADTTERTPEATYYIAAMSLAQLGKADSAQILVNAASSTVPSLSNRVLRMVAEREVALARGDYRTAHLLGEQATHINDSISHSNASEQLRQAEQRLQQQEQQLQRAEQSRERILLWAIIGVLALALAFAAYVIVSRRQRAQEEQLELIERLQLEHTREKEQLQAQLLSGTREGDEQLQEILSKQIENIRSLIDLSYKNTARPEKFLERFQDKIKQSRLPDGFWGNLRYYVDARYNGIISRLEREHPNLSDDDLYIIGLLCCGFTYADITVCMGYANINYVNTKKSRIAKKMGIDQPLSDYLRDQITPTKNQ